MCFMYMSSVRIHTHLSFRIRIHIHLIYRIRIQIYLISRIQIIIHLISRIQIHVYLISRIQIHINLILLRKIPPLFWPLGRYEMSDADPVEICRYGSYGTVPKFGFKYVTRIHSTGVAGGEGRVAVRMRAWIPPLPALRAAPRTEAHRRRPAPAQ